jgi:hypothetical protein
MSKIRVEFHEVQQCFLVIKLSLYMFRPSSEGNQHFKGNASHVLHACCLVWVTLVLEIVKIDLLKLIEFPVN